MGSGTSESFREADEAQHTVKLTKGFYISIHEVTQKQWETVMKTNPSNVRGAKLPVETVTWNEAVAFCTRLSKKEGRKYRLPTEAEWEFACRAGGSGPYAGTGRAQDMGWSNEDRVNTQPVGTKKPNAWGIYDMHGNVEEWCSDWYGEYSRTEQIDPQGPTSGFFRVIRGGSYLNPASNCRCAKRMRAPSSMAASFLGFRVALEGSESANTKDTGSGSPNKGSDQDKKLSGSELYNLQIEWRSK